MNQLPNLFKITNILSFRRTLLGARNNLPCLNIAAGAKMGISIEEKVGLPPKPKKPLTPYFRFLQTNRAQVAAKNPEASFTELIRIIAKSWQTVDDGTKKKLEEEYKKEQKVYVEKKAIYDSKLTDDNKRDIKQAKLDASEAKEKRAMKKRIRELGRPKKPATAFFRYLSEERNVTPRGKFSYTDWMKNASKKWMALTDAQKAPYIRATLKEAEKFKIEIAKWEEKMIKEGNVDVVRNEALIDVPPPKPRRKSISE